jgi:hypothetical protein
VSGAPLAAAGTNPKVEIWGLFPEAALTGGITGSLSPFRNLICLPARIVTIAF